MPTMQGTANPLRKSKPPKEEWVHHGRFYFTDENGRMESALGAQICLTREELWITSDLSIPLGRIDSMGIVERRGVPPRRFLRIGYVNPITKAREAVFLCKLDSFGIGLYRMGPIEELLQRIEELRAKEGSRPSVVAVGKAEPEAAPAPDRCEACGEKPAVYVGYVYLVSAILVCYRSAAKRRIHCRKHNALHGLGYYLLTVLTGWIGIGIIPYPFVVYAAARNLAPSLGSAWYALGVLPTLGAAAVLACLIL